jgi:hypothetical protein
VVEHLICKLEALSSKPIPTEREREREREREAEVRVNNDSPRESGSWDQELEGRSLLTR